MSDNRNLDLLLKQMAEDHRPELPSPGLIWWRAQILRKQREKERIEQPLMIMRWVAAVVCIVAFVALLAGNWRQFQVTIGDNYWSLMLLGVLAVAVSAVSVFLLFWLRAWKV